MPAAPSDTEALTRLVRACFNRLKSLADGMHRDLGITAAMRAVLESLAEADRQTVPQIARAKGVSRQHIQALTNALVEAALVTVEANPADRRSPHVRLTPLGRERFRTMRTREQQVRRHLERAMPAGDLKAAVRSLQALRTFLDEIIEKGKHHDR